MSGTGNEIGSGEEKLIFTYIQLLSCGVVVRWPLGSRSAIEASTQAPISDLEHKIGPSADKPRG